MLDLVRKESLCPGLTICHGSADFLIRGKKDITFITIYDI